MSDRRDGRLGPAAGRGGVSRVHEKKRDDHHQAPANASRHLGEGHQLHPVGCRQDRDIACSPIPL